MSGAAKDNVGADDLVMPGLGRRVLLVDDDPLLRKLVRTQLEAAGFSVETACGATEALETVRRIRPDAVVSDVLMDDTDGFALCRILRRDPALATIPIVLISAYFNETDDRALAREVGASALVERSPGMQRMIESLVRGLAEGRQSVPEVHMASELHVRRVAHQLARLRDDSARSEARYLALFENANDAVAILTPAGVVVEVNRRWEALMRRPRSELVGLHVRDFVAEGEKEEAAADYRAAAASSSHSRQAPVAIAGGNGTVYLQFTTNEIEVHGQKHVLSIGRDVTELVTSHRALAESEQRYRSLLENIPEVVWSSTKDFQLQFMSTNALAMTGFTAQELTEGIAGGVDARVHPCDAVRFRAGFGLLMADGTPIDMEYRWQHRDGRWIWMHCRAVLARHLDGREYVDGTFSDVTARHLVEEQLVRSQKIEALGQLTAGIAHDFNNILAVIVGNAEYLGSILPPAGEAQEVAGEITVAAQRGTALTSRLLAFARRESAEPCPLDLGQVVRELEPLIARAVGKSVALKVGAAPKTAAIRGVASEIEQIIMNLAVNARDAMPSGGELSIETAEVAVAEGAPGTPPPGRWVMLAVKDSGIGMDDATRERIFEPFFTTKGEGKGTGLGLSTSYGIVRRHDGHVIVDSAPGAGTTFQIYFPVDPPSAASASATSRTSRSASMGFAM